LIVKEKICLWVILSFFNQFLHLLEGIRIAISRPSMKPKIKKITLWEGSLKRLQTGNDPQFPTTFFHLFSFPLSSWLPDQKECPSMNLFKKGL